MFNLKPNHMKKLFVFLTLAFFTLASYGYSTITRDENQNVPAVQLDCAVTPVVAPQILPALEIFTYQDSPVNESQTYEGIPLEMFTGALPDSMAPLIQHIDKSSLRERIQEVRKRIRAVNKQRIELHRELDRLTYLLNGAPTNDAVPIH